MDIFIVCVRSAVDDYEESAVVVAPDRDHAIKQALNGCAFPVVAAEIECEPLCEDEPCVIWFD